MSETCHQVPTLFAITIIASVAGCAVHEPAPVAAPQLLSCAPLAYPTALEARRIEGKVVLEGVVDTTGRVDPATVRVVSASHAAFTQSAREMMLTCRFDVTRQEGRPVAALVRLPVAFEIQRAGTVSAADSTAARARLEHAGQLIRTGQISQALAGYAEARRLDARVADGLVFWLDQCLYGALWGCGDEVSSQCSEAVAVEPNNPALRRARAVARAVTGDFPGAISDLETAATLTADRAALEEHARWIAALRAGTNPFTAEVLAALRARR